MPSVRRKHASLECTACTPDLTVHFACAAPARSGELLTWLEKFMNADLRQLNLSPPQRFPYLKNLLVRAGLNSLLAVRGSSELRSSELSSAVRAPRGCQGSSSVFAGTGLGQLRALACRQPAAGVHAGFYNNGLARAGLCRDGLYTDGQVRAGLYKNGLARAGLNSSLGGGTKMRFAFDTPCVDLVAGADVCSL